LAITLPSGDGAVARNNGQFTISIRWDATPGEEDEDGEDAVEEFSMETRL
jgi:hypothetical protein